MIDKLSDTTTFSVQMATVQMSMTKSVDNPVWKCVVNRVSTSVWHPVWDGAWHSEQIIKNCISQASYDYFKTK
jgi:hypothetical protein